MNCLHSDQEKYFKHYNVLTVNTNHCIPRYMLCIQSNPYIIGNKQIFMGFFFHADYCFYVFVKN